MSTATAVEAQVLTREEAELIIRNTAIEAYEQEGYRWLDTDSLTRKLSYYLDADVNAGWVDELVGNLRDLEQVEDGTSEELMVNADLTVNNRPYLVAYYEGEANVSVNRILDLAHFEGAWIMRHSA